MKTTVQWQVDASTNTVHLTVQQELVLTPTRFSLSFESLELMYCQMLNGRIKVREDAKKKVLT